jgi:hypothetical protein
MLAQTCLSLALLAAMPVWSQALPTATAGPDIPQDEYRMPIPPMVSGQAFPTSTLSETRSNYLDADLSFQPTYYDNLLPGYGAQPVSDMGYSIRPMLELDRLTPRLHQTWTYQPGFTLYQRTSARNEVDQSAALDMQYRLSQHITVSGRDAFQKSSNVFNQPYSLSGESISGAPPSSPADVIAPFANQLSNTANAELAYQFSMNGMIGAGGTTAMFDYPGQAESSGLYDSASRGGSAFYSRRLSGTQSLGATYQYVTVLGSPVTGPLEIQTHTVFLFYTAALGERFSLSLAAGPQHYYYALSPLPASSSWTPAATGSLGWQGERTSFAASYSRSVTGGGGLLGAMSSNKASASAHWQMARTWTITSTAGYSIYKNVSPLSLSSYPGGHSVSGAISIDHTLSDHFRARLGYQRLHNTYNGIAAIAADPDADSAFISISYQLSRPLGR